MTINKNTYISEILDTSALNFPCTKTIINLLRENKKNTR